MTRKWIFVIGLLVAACAWWPSWAQPQPQAQQKRVALVVGNSAYSQGALPTAANDAGLIAQTLQAAGFDVVGARDLDAETLRRSFRDFIQKVQSSGPETVAFVYLAGYGLQLTGDNYFVPVDAQIKRDTDIPAEALRISDYTRQLSALPLQAGIIVVDAARETPFAKEGQPIAGGLALVEPEPHMLVAFNAAPGTIGPEGQPPYGAYAQALAEMIRAGGLKLSDVFDQVRLRVSEMTKGAEVPWNTQKLESDFVFFERAPDAPPAPELTGAVRTKPIRDYDARDAFIAALDRDTLQGYEDFLAAFPEDPLAKRVRAIVAARREAIIWRRTMRANTPPAYWSYLQKYPRGPHAADARRRLAILAAALEPPPTFTPVVYDVPPPPPEEIVYVSRPVLYFSDPVFAFAPPPPPPVFFLPPPPPDFVVLVAPPPPVELFVLPTPFFVPIPTYVVAPRYVAPPPNNIIYANIHNTTVINTVINNRTATPAPGADSGGRRSLLPAAAAVLPAAAALRARMPARPGISATTGAPLPKVNAPPRPDTIKPGAKPLAPSVTASRPPAATGRNSVTTNAATGPTGKGRGVATPHTGSPAGAGRAAVTSRTGTPPSSVKPAGAAAAPPRHPNATRTIASRPAPAHRAAPIVRPAPSAARVAPRPSAMPPRVSSAPRPMPQMQARPAPRPMPQMQARPAPRPMAPSRSSCRPGTRC